MSPETISVDGKIISYRTSGKGHDVVLLHGFGEDGTVWENQYDAFPGYRIVIPDMPGSGGSEMTDDMSMEGLARTIKNFLSAIGISKCSMIGHSMGGYIMLAFAEM